MKQRFPYSVINDIVAAIGGETSLQGATRFQADVFSHKPHLVTIDDSLSDKGHNLGEVEVSWRSMIESALIHDIHVILLTPG